MGLRLSRFRPRCTVLCIVMSRIQLFLTQLSKRDSWYDLKKSLLLQGCRVVSKITKKYVIDDLISMRMTEFIFSSISTKHGPLKQNQFLIGQSSNLSPRLRGIKQKKLIHSLTSMWRRGGLMVSALASGSSGLGSSPGRGHLCCVLEQDTLLSRCLSPPGCINGYRRILCWG